MNDQTPQPRHRDDDVRFSGDAQLDLQLRAFFRSELDPQRGTAMRKLDALRLERARHRGSPAGPWRVALRWSAAAVLLVGVGTAISVVGAHLRSGHGQPIAITSVNRPADAIVTSWAETYDAGTVLVDPETPARMLRRVQYEKTEWKDAAGKWQSITKTPQQDVILVDLQKQ